ncbi:hypothetical protein TUE45_pSRTUE45c_0401 (plasmid) [Streptomyces reticuli]|nr:hypothetical protein TUE45_pSRTUE45c_0401 [Streptomyces reticuli]
MTFNAGAEVGSCGGPPVLEVPGRCAAPAAAALVALR